MRVSELIDMLKDLCSLIRNMPKPVAVAVRGHCLGGATNAYWSRIRCYTDYTGWSTSP